MEKPSFETTVKKATRIIDTALEGIESSFNNADKKKQETAQYFKDLKKNSPVQKRIDEIKRSFK